MQKFLNFIVSPAKALYSISFYFDVLFKVKGIGFLYLLFISFIVSIPSTYKLYSVFTDFANSELKLVLSSIPKSYFDGNGRLCNASNQDVVKEIYLKDGTLAVLYNVENESVNTSSVPVVELNSNTFTVNFNSKRNVFSYAELVGTKASFDDIVSMHMVNSVIKLSNLFSFILFTLWAFLMLGVNVLFTAALSSIAFIFVGRMKTGFSNVVRLSCYANTISAVAIIVQAVFEVSFSYFVIMLLPMIYMLLFIKHFYDELVTKGIDSFINNHNLHEAKVITKKYDENGNLERTEATSNTGSDTLRNEETKSNKKDDNDKNNKGFFAP